MADDTQPQDKVNPDAKYTDKDLDKYKGDARREGREAAERAIAEQLGVSVEDAKQIVADRKTADDANKSALDKANDDLAKAMARAEKAEALAETRLVDAKLERALVNGGIPAGDTGRLADAMKLAGRDGLKVKEDGTVEGLDKSIEALKGTSSYLFEAPTQSAPRRAPDADAPQPDPLDVSSMSKEDFAKLQGKVLAGEQIAPAQTT